MEASKVSVLYIYIDQITILTNAMLPFKINKFSQNDTKTWLNLKKNFKV